MFHLLIWSHTLLKEITNKKECVWLNLNELGRLFEAGLF